MILKLPVSPKERTAWVYLAALLILFPVLFAYHVHVKLDYSWNFIFDQLPPVETWPYPLLVVVGIVGIYLQWGGWTGVFILCLQLWLFRRLLLADLWVFITILCIAISIVAGIYSTFVGFDRVTTAEIALGAFSYFALFAMPMFAVLIILTLLRLMKGHQLVRSL